MIYRSIGNIGSDRYNPSMILLKEILGRAVVQTLNLSKYSQKNYSYWK